MYALDYSERFLKHLERLSSKERRQVAKKLHLLATNPNHPSLRSKHIQSGKGSFECSVNMDLRIAWHYGDSNVIVLTNIGHHDMLDRF